MYPDKVVRRALGAVSVTQSGSSWLTLAPGQRAALIYQEIRRLDLILSARPPKSGPTMQFDDESRSFSETNSTHMTAVLNE